MATVYLGVSISAWHDPNVSPVSGKASVSYKVAIANVWLSPVHQSQGNRLGCLIMLTPLCCQLLRR